MAGRGPGAMYLSQFPLLAITEKLAHRLHCVIQLNFPNLTKLNLWAGKETTGAPNVNFRKISVRKTI